MHVCQAFARDSVVAKCKMLFCVVPHLACSRLDVASSPLLGPQWDWGVVIFPSSQGRSHFEVVLVPVRSACTLTGWWNHFGWALAKGVFKVTVPQEKREVGHAMPVRSMLVCCIRGPAATWEKCPGLLGWRRVDHTVRARGQGALLASQVESVGCCAGSHRCLYI